MHDIFILHVTCICFDSLNVREFFSAVVMCMNYFLVQKCLQDNVFKITHPSLKSQFVHP